MKKILGIALGILLVAASSVAMAQNVESALANNGDNGATPYIRYYTYDFASNAVNPNGVNVCPAWDPPYCGAVFKSKRTSWRAYSEVVSNFDGAPLGTIIAAVWDLELGTGADRAAYYGFGASVTSSSDTMLWSDIECVGTSPATCIGPFNPARAAGSDIADVPGGTLAPADGLRPVPVPLVQDGLDPIQLSWDAAVGVGEAATQTIQYDLYFSRDENGNGTCEARSGTFTFLRTEPGTTASVTYADIGGEAGADCVAFAIGLRYPNAGGGNEIVSRYLSKAGQSVLLGDATAADVYDLAARRAGGLAVEVTWKTSLENGVVGFYVTRALTENGPFTRVSDLIPAKGEPSAYSFVDALDGQIQGRVSATGLFYKVESVDIDDQIVPFGPVKAELGLDPQQGRGRLLQRQR